jgi:predicted RNase H-like HicB family nuclease
VTEQSETFHYAMVIQWSDENSAVSVTVPELPGCMTHGDTDEAATKHRLEAIESWIETNRAWGHPIRAPRTGANA